jgi:hypothetical protein
VVVAEIKLIEIALQVLLAAMLVHASHAALEDGEEAFNRVRVRTVANVFVPDMLHDLMRSEVLADILIELALIGMQFGLRVGVAHKDLFNRRNVRAIDTEHAGLAAAHQTDNRLVVAFFALTTNIRRARRV